MWAAPSTTLTLYLKPFKELGLDSQSVKKLASKLHVHSVNYAAKLVHTRRACHAQLLAVTIRVILLVGFSVEVVLPGFVQEAGKASLLKIAFSGQLAQ